MTTVKIFSTNKNIRPRVCRLAIWLFAGLGWSSFASPSVNLKWNPSSSPGLTGYKIYYGTTSGNYTQAISVGTVTNATISGLSNGTMYYFVATTCNTNLNLESAPSNEASFTTPNPPTLAINVIQENGTVASVAVSASGSVPGQWVLEASPDLHNWTPVLRGTNAPVSYSASVAGQPAQFFRLMSE